MGDEEVVFKLRDAIRHSMDSYDTCYALEDTWIRDELSELLDEEEPLDGIVDETHHQDNL